jgi:hypothetical protein
VSEAKPRLTVARTAQNDTGQREIILTLDGRRWETLTSGGSAERELRPGRHTLKADNTLFRKTVEFDAAPGEQIRFTVANVNGPGTWIFLMVGAPILYLRLEREE